MSISTDNPPPVSSSSARKHEHKERPCIVKQPSPSPASSTRKRKYNETDTNPPILALKQPPPSLAASTQKRKCKEPNVKRPQSLTYSSKETSTKQSSSLPSGKVKPPSSLPKVKQLPSLTSAGPSTTLLNKLLSDPARESASPSIQYSPVHGQPPSSSTSFHEQLSPIKDKSPQPISISCSPVRDDPNIWISALVLYQRDRAILQSKDWLNDGIIFAAQSLLREQTKEKVCGWQSTQCGKEEGRLFDTVPQNCPFVQILHVTNCHWVVTSNMNVRDQSCYSDVVCIYDSGRPTNIGLNLRKTVCSFFKCPSDIMRFDAMNVVAQPNA